MIKTSTKVCESILAGSSAEGCVGSRPNILLWKDQKKKNVLTEFRITTQEKYVLHKF